jgi:hypothetical protein
MYYLFVPSGILLSRSFQPDALMMLTFLGSLLAVWTYYERPSAASLAIAGSIAGLTLLHRPLVLFALFGAFAALAVTRHGAAGLIRRHTLTYVLLASVPSALYYGYGIFIADFMRWKVASSFRPYLLLHHEFWTGWFLGGVNEIGAAALVGALAGLALLRRGMPVALIVGLGIGYVVFGLVFTMHIHTHGYYHAQLIPVVAIPLGALVAELVDRWRALCDRWYWWLPAAAAVMLVAWLGQNELRSRLDAQAFESERVARQIGGLVRHSKHVVFLSRYYGMPLQSHGELTGSYWPRSIGYWLYRTEGERSLTIDERLAALGFAPEYFVITDFREFDRNHADLKAYLTERCSLMAADPEYLVYNSCERRPTSHRANVQAAEAVTP